ncbi:MAG: DUF86 domain-containing protein [bacterium]
MSKKKEEHRDPLLYLDDIVDSCRKIKEYVNSYEGKNFTLEEKTLDAVVRNLITIGEAAGKVPVEIRKIEPDVDWRKLRSIRNFLAHEYFGVDLEIVKDLVENKVPRIEEKVTALIESLNQQG